MVSISSGPRRRTGLALVAALLLAGCSQKAEKGPAAEKPRVEADLSRTTISAQAAKSLGIQSEPVRNQKVQERIAFTGWIMPRPGSEIHLTAPVGGIVRVAKELPLPGKVYEKDQVVFHLEPVLTPIEEIQLASLKRGIESEAARAKENVTVNRSELDRTEELFRQKLRAKQDVEQAQAKLKIAQEELAAAQEKLKLFAGVGQSQAPQPLRVPESSTVLAIAVGPGQYVPAGAPIVTLVNMDNPWVRVPIPENDLPRVDQKKPVLVQLRSVQARPVAKNAEQPAVAPFITARPVGLVPQVDPARHTADLQFEIDKKDLPVSLVKDQMVTVYVGLGGEAEETIVPDSAVIFDAFGGTWVYLDQTQDTAGTHVYERRRVELGPGVERGLIVRPALKAGERVVSFGAGVLFSREFYKPPVPNAP